MPDGNGYLIKPSTSDSIYVKQIGGNSRYETGWYSDQSRALLAGENNGPTYGRIARTNDSGNTWVTSDFYNLSFPQDMQFVNDSTVYLVGIPGDYTYKSTNGGLSWYSQVKNDALDGTNYGLNELSCPSDSVCYAVHSYYIYKTTNGGGPMTPVGTDELHQSIDFRVYPNPSDGQYNVSVPSFGKNKRIEVYNMQGQLVRSFNPQSNNYELDIMDYPAGLYLIRLTVDGISGTERVVKQ